MKIAESPRFTVDVSDDERSCAKNVKKEFKLVIEDLENALKLVYDFKDAVVKQRPDQDTLQTTYHGRILRYRRKIVVAFNQLLNKLKNTVDRLQSILDPEMVNLRQVIMSEFNELSNVIENVLDLLKNPGSEGFTNDLEKACTQLQRRKQSIEGIIDNQMIEHLERDILGKMKISSIKNRIIKRKRLTRLLEM